MRSLRRPLPPSPDPGPVVFSRSRRLRDAGVSPQLADQLAQNSAYNLYDILELVSRGCPPKLAARILAPIDGAPPGC